MLTAIAQAKGGVGKTTSAINIGVLLARQDRRVLLVDTDPQAALTRQLGLEPDSAPTLVDVLTGTADAGAAIRSPSTASTSSRRAGSGRCRDEPRRRDRPRAIPTRRSRRHDRELRRAPHRHPTQPRIAHGKRARLRYLRNRPGQRRRRRSNSRNRRAPQDHSPPKATAQHRRTNGDASDHTVDANAPQQSDRRAQAQRA